MPLYEYECAKCGHRFEVIQKFSDPLADTCPKCKGKVSKLPSAPAIRFKGSGWYVTDYGGKGKGSESDKGSSGGEKPSASEPAASTGSADKGTKSPGSGGKDAPSTSGPGKSAGSGGKDGGSAGKGKGKP